MLFLIFITLSLSILVQAAEKIYKSVDEKGNVIFSDVPTEKSEEVTIPPASTFQAPTIPPSIRKSSSTGDPYRYSLLEISSPANDSVFFGEDADSIEVTVHFEPEKRFDHKLGLKVNNVRQSGMVLQNLSRGTYTLVAEIYDAAGDVVISSESTQIHVKRHIIKKKSKPEPAPKPTPPTPVPSVPSGTFNSVTH